MRGWSRRRRGPPAEHEARSGGPEHDAHTPFLSAPTSTEELDALYLLAVHRHHARDRQGDTRTATSRRLLRLGRRHRRGDRTVTVRARCAEAEDPGARVRVPARGRRRAPVDDRRSHGAALPLEAASSSKRRVAHSDDARLQRAHPLPHPARPHGDPRRGGRRGVGAGRRIPVGQPGHLDFVARRRSTNGAEGRAIVVVSDERQQQSSVEVEVRAVKQLTLSGASRVAARLTTPFNITLLDELRVFNEFLCSVCPCSTPAPTAYASSASHERHVLCEGECAWRGGGGRYPGL